MESGPKMPSPEEIAKLEKSRKEAFSVAESEMGYHGVKDPIDVLHDDAKYYDELRTDDLRYKAVAKEAEMKKELVKSIERGEQEVPEKIRQAVQEASDLFWKKFDEYIRVIKSGQKVDSPSRNKHRQLFLDGCKTDEDCKFADGYWGVLFNKEMEKRGIHNITPEEMNKIMYQGIFPESLKLPEQE